MPRIATLQELEIIALIRMYEDGTLVWKTRQGDTLPVRQMGDSHLVNTIKMLRRNEEHIKSLENTNTSDYEYDEVEDLRGLTMEDIC